MAEDWAIDVRKYVPDADEAAIAGIVRYCGIALRNRDSSLVSFTDPAETDRVRENYLKKKLALTDPDPVLDAAIAKVGERMKADTTRNRVTVYYLLAEAFGKLGLFISAKAASAAAGASDALPLVAPVAAPAPAAPIAAAAAVAAPVMAAAVAKPPERPLGIIGSGAAAAPKRKASGLGGFGQYLPLALMILGGIGLLYWLTRPRTPVVPAPVVAAAPEVPAAAPVAAPVIPVGSGVVSTETEGKPLVSVYFDTAKTDLSPDIVPAIAVMKTYLEANPGSKLAVSGYNDARGDAAMNAELSKNRAIAVRDALVAAGIPEASVELVKPAETTDTETTLTEARRVDIRVL